MAENIDDGDVDNGLELSKELVSNHGTKDGSEIAEHREGVVDDGGLVLGEVKLLLQVDGEDGLHAVVRKSFTKLISNNEEHALRVRNSLEQQKNTFVEQNSFVVNYFNIN